MPPWIPPVPDRNKEESSPEKALMKKVLGIYDKQFVADYLNLYTPGAWCRETISRWMTGRLNPKMSLSEYLFLKQLLPIPVVTPGNARFRFIDLFAGIGGIRKGFEEAGGLCVFTSEWDKEAMRTYRANFACDTPWHRTNGDIREVTLSDKPGLSTEEVDRHINEMIPDHEILLAGFPCQPFSIAGVSKKNSMGRKTGFEDKAQGTLFFDTARIIRAKKPAIFVLENVKNLKSHDHGRTFRVIMETLDELGYRVSDSVYSGKRDPKIIDGQYFVPQHRERIVLVGFRKDLHIGENFTLKNICRYFPEKVPELGDILEKEPDEKYILTPHLWKYLFDYANKHKAKGNGFGFGLTNAHSVTRTLSARYYKDGSEILIDRGWDFSKGFEDKENLAHRPRRLTPLECSRLMGFNGPGESKFRIPVSDTRAYKQFGNSVVVPVFRAVAKMLITVIDELGANHIIK
ncbi:MAG: DNA (cytosine-5-)-methyltransferase [Mesosutterella sp.]|nr:DNA (cytosine-5-)-methyltransferase [Mesosutterella sp.]